MNKTVAIIGGGVAGIETAIQLEKLGYNITLYEKETSLGGHVAKWDRLFPNQRHASDVLESLKKMVKGKISLKLSTQVQSLKQDNGSFIISSDNLTEKVDSVVISTGFELFQAERKEEYGYGIFDNVITSAELEGMFAKYGKPIMTNGNNPRRISFIHCVGSRDEKVSRPYCSKVCCVTAVKQAIEVKEILPNTEVFCLYMDLRMFGLGYEELYKDAQVKGVSFIRGRLSETSELPDGQVLIKAEDTLAQKPFRMAVDMVVLMVGMSPLESTKKLCGSIGLVIDKDEFVKSKDYHLNPTHTSLPGIFVAGACSGPNNITDSINAARSAAIEVHNYLIHK